MAGTARLRAAQLVALFLLALACAAPSARGADTIYWVAGSGDARSGALAGGGTVNTLYSGQGLLDSMTLNPQDGALLWGRFSIGVQRAPIEGGGTVTTLQPAAAGVAGVVADPAAARLYWSNGSGQNVRGGALAGGGAVDDLYGGFPQPSGVTIDPAAGRIYFMDANTNSIFGAPIAGGGTVDLLYDGGDGVNAPFGIAVDAAAGQLYWSNATGDTIMRGPVSGAGAPTTLYSPDNVRGIAIDPDGGRIYWVTFGGLVQGAPIAGGGTVDSLYTGQSNAQGVAVLRTPVPVTAPAVSGGGQTGQQLICTDGTWQAKGVGTQVFNAPTTTTRQWTRDGNDIAAATGAAFTPTAAGAYSCRNTATNAAGSTSQTSPTVNVTAAPTPSGPPARKCKKLRKKLNKWQARKLALARTGKKRAYIERNIEDTKRRLKKLGC